MRQSFKTLGILVVFLGIALAASAGSVLFWVWVLRMFGLPLSFWYGMVIFGGLVALIVVMEVLRRRRRK